MRDPLPRLLWTARPPRSGWYLLRKTWGGRYPPEDPVVLVDVLATPEGLQYRRPFHERLERVDGVDGDCEWAEIIELETTP